MKTCIKDVKKGDLISNAGLLPHPTSQPWMAVVLEAPVYATTGTVNVKVFFLSREPKIQIWGFPCLREVSLEDEIP